MVINERCINILSVLNETNKFTLKKLSESFDVHERTIRYDIDNINYILKTYKLDEIKKCDGGVFTVNLKSSELNKIISDFGGMFSENRKSYLKLKIFSAEMINLTKEAEFLNVSRTTLKKDMNTIKNELKEQGIEIQELPSKGIKVEGDSDYIVRAFAKELQKLIENQFVNLPNILKDTVGKIVGDITPNVLKSRVENILGERYSLIEYNKVFCRLAALNTRFKLERKKRGYNIEEVNTFVMCSQGKEFISKITSEEYKAKDNISGFQNVFKNVIDTLELNSCTEIFENLLSSIKHNKDNKELVNVSEKICETNFYKEFAKKLENSELLEKEIRSIFYFLYSQMTLVSCEKFKNLKVLFICDGSEFIRNIVEKKLKTLFNFARIDKVSSHIFEIFGCEDEYDLIITNKNINEILETPIYKISKFPLESDFMDLKYFLLKTDSNK